MTTEYKLTLTVTGCAKCPFVEDKGGDETILVCSRLPRATFSSNAPRMPNEGIYEGCSLLSEEAQVELKLNTLLAERDRRIAVRGQRERELDLAQRAVCEISVQIDDLRKRQLAIETHNKASLEKKP